MKESGIAGSTSSKYQEDSHHRTLFEPVQEVRFAVVLFGGVSLAVYINGVVQELFHLVRASAPDPVMVGEKQFALLDDCTENKLSPTEKIYRELAMRLPKDLHDAGKIRTRFVIDVISGTSAGGINGIFLAKALAHNLDLKPLADLWEQEGDLAKLLNDKKSYEGLDVRRGPTLSLLNSRRMTTKLLQAFQEVESSKTAGIATPLVDELDLHVTATDLRGKLTQVGLGRKKIYERHYGHTFHLHFATGKSSSSPADHFSAEFDPFLTFVARATSSFPVAFEPATLAEVEKIVGKAANGKKLGQIPEAWPEKWRELYEDYRGNFAAAGAADPDQQFRLVSFGDGGILDNKPFSRIIDAIAARPGGIAVQRKLLYVEPSPEHPEDIEVPTSPPDALEHLKLALFDIKMNETIREDLQRIEEYNRLIGRVWIARFGQQQDIIRSSRRNPENFRIQNGDWMQQDLPKMIEVFGIGYGPHHRVRVSTFTKDLAALIASSWWIRPTSPLARAIHEVVKAWRKRGYELCQKDDEPPVLEVEVHRDFLEFKVPEPAERKKTENQLLGELDIWWLLRRLRFVRQQMSEINTSPKQLQYHLENLVGKAVAANVNYDERQMFLFRSKSRKISEKLGQIGAGIEEEIGSLRGSQAKSFRDMKGLERALFDLLEVSGAPRGFREIEHEAEALLEKPVFGPALEHAITTMTEKLSNLRSESRKKAKLHLPLAAEPIDFDGEFWLDPEATAERIASFYYRHFEQYDLAVFSLLHGTGCEEASRIEVLRISPEDADGIYDQRHRGKAKLSGDALIHFGAFLEERGRRNDRIWGRLDAAERILDALVVDPEERRHWREHLQQAILTEELMGKADVTIGDVIEQDRNRHVRIRESGFWRRQWVAIKAKMFEAGADGDPLLSWFWKLPERHREDLRSYLMGKIAPDQLVKVFAETSVAREPLAVERQMELVARSANVVAEIFDTRPEKEQPWLRKLSQIPRTMATAVTMVLAFSAGSNLAFAGVRKIAQLFLGLAAVMVVLLTFFGQDEPAKWFFTVGMLVFVFLEVCRAISSWWKGGYSWFYWKTILVLLALGLVTLGIFVYLQAGRNLITVFSHACG